MVQRFTVHGWRVIKIESRRCGIAVRGSINYLSKYEERNPLNREPAKADKP